MTINERVKAAKNVAIRAGFNATQNMLETFASEYTADPWLAVELARFADWLLAANPHHKRVFVEQA